MKFKNIIWDWNGTLVDDASLFVDVMNQNLSNYGLEKINVEKYKNSFCFPIQKYWKKLGFVFNDCEFNTINASFINQYKQRMFEPALKHRALFVLKKINKLTCRQFVLSASEHKILNQLVKFYKINNYFTDVCGVNNLNALGKEQLGKILMEKHFLIPSETVLIGDTEYDLRVANSLGCSCLLMSCGHFSKKRLLKHSHNVVDGLDAVLQFLTQ